MLPTKESVWTKCVAGLPSWKNTTPDSICVDRLFGMSNLTLAVSIKDPFLLSQNIFPTKVLLRIFPEHGSRVISRSKEHAIFTHLAETPNGIKMYYSCPQYRIEEFFDGEKLSMFELNNKLMMKHIATMFCDYHHDPVLFNIIGQFDPKVPFAERWLTDWLAPFKENFEMYASKIKSEEGQILIKKLQYLTTPEFEKEYKALIQSLSGTELVSSHCDVHEMNMLRSYTNKERLILIDFEYSTYNYRAIDIATLLVETMIDQTHPAFPYNKLYESNKWDDEELTRFIKFYLERDAVIKFKENIEEYVAKETPILFSEVKRCEAIVSASWAVWSLLVANWKTFDEAKDWNLIYGSWRLSLYEKAKVDALKLI